MCLTPMTQTALSAVDANRAGMASAVHNALRQVGQVFGVAVLGLLIYAHLPNGTSSGGRLSPTQQALFVEGLHHAMWVSGLALLATAALVALLFSLRRPGHQRNPEPTQQQEPEPPHSVDHPATPPSNGHATPVAPSQSAIGLRNGRGVIWFRRVGPMGNNGAESHGKATPHARGRSSLNSAWAPAPSLTRAFVPDWPRTGNLRSATAPPQLR